MNIDFGMWSIGCMTNFIFSLFGNDAATTDTTIEIEWIQLTPAGVFTACDGRGPFVADVDAIFKAAKGRKLPIDINHAIDIKGAKGEPSPAVGWIEELQARKNGIWGRVNWTDAGLEILQRREYGAISPVLIATKDKPARVVEIARASLCNDPALPQLNRLFNKNGETTMDKELRAVLGLPETASDDEVLASVKDVKASQKDMTATFSSLKKEIGLDEKTDVKTTVEAFKSRLNGNSSTTELEEKVSQLNAKLVEVEHQRVREKAEAFVARAIADFKILPALRDHFIDRYCRTPAEVEKEISAMPALMQAGLAKSQLVAEGSLSDEEKRVCELMGVSEKAFQDTRKKEKL